MSEISETARDQLDPELGESSEGEGDVEIEHLGDESVEVQEDNAENPPLVVSNYSSTSPMGDVRPASNITLDIRKRTLITFAQRTVLEDLYRNGMSSASLQLHHLHVLAAERTGLDLAVVKVSDALIFWFTKSLLASFPYLNGLGMSLITSRVKNLEIGNRRMLFLYSK